MNIFSAEAKPSALGLRRSDARRVVAPKPAWQGSDGATRKCPFAALRDGSEGLAGRLSNRSAQALCAQHRAA